MAPLQSAHAVGVPVYGAAFVDSDHVVCAGGGGAGRNGVANKLVRAR